MNATLHTTIIPSPLGDLLAVATPHTLYALDFADKDTLDGDLRKLASLLGSQISNQTTPLLEDVKQQLCEYFSGSRKKFDIPIDTLGTEFQKQCWLAIQTIPYAHTISYAQQANNISRHKATRAVGSANGKNRISIIIPCHRVVGSNGSLGGYAGGLERKKWLLAHEQQWK